MSGPTHGHTRDGRPVHGRTLDHLPVHTAYARFNKSIALKVTAWVGSMTCAWVFCLLALFSLPAVLSAFHLFHGAFPRWIISPSIIALVAWVAQTFLQLVLLSVIMVGQQAQSDASDARSARTLEDAEHIADALDVRTEGGLKVVLDAIHALAGGDQTTPTSTEVVGPSGEGA